MNTQWLRINQLDRQLKEWRDLSQKYSQPRAGWVKTLRIALSMSDEQMAARLGVTRARIAQLEKSECRGAVSLHTLNKAAEAMGCELVYAIIPKIAPTLKDIIRTRAEQIASENIKKVAHSMSLEDQSVDKNLLEIQKEELVKDLMDHRKKKLWKKFKE